jgi:hypothetical protein
MSKILVTVLASSFLMLSGAGLALAAPTNNGDGSQTCNASGPSGGTTPGVCANTLAENESFCDGGLSSEPGGGTTCSPSASSAQGRKTNQLKQNAGPAPTRRPVK